MGGIGGNLHLSMLNGTEAQTLGKSAQHVSSSSSSSSSSLLHLHHRTGTGTGTGTGTKDLTELKMGIQDARFYYPDSGGGGGGGGQDALTLPYHAEAAAAAAAAAAHGRFYSPSCGYGTVRSPQRSGGGAGAQGFPGGEDLYHHPPSPDPYHHFHPGTGGTGGGPGTGGGGFQHGFHPRPPLYPLPGLQVSGKTQALLNNYPLWAKFHKFQTEMIITKQGRRMFPFLSFNLSSLEPSAHYNVYVDVVLADQHHWRYQGGKWVQCGKAEGNMPGNRMYMHPDSPNTGAHWMRQEVSFSKLKLTNNKGGTNNVAQMVVLQSLHKYQPRLHLVEVKEDGSEEPYLSAKAQTFVFPETQFIAVTAYQNADITQLKIDHNPFAKGFRDNYDTLYAPPDPERLSPPSPCDPPQQLLPGGCFPQSFLSDQYLGALPPQSRFFGRDAVTPQHKEAGGPAAGGAGAGASPSPAGPAHSCWYLPAQQVAPPGRLDFASSYDAAAADFSGNGFYKPFPLQAAPHHHHHHHHLGFYPEHPFAPGAASGWGGGGRPVAAPPYLSHPGKHGGGGGGGGWFRPVSTSSSSSSSSSVSPGNVARLRPPSLLESLQPQPPPPQPPPPLLQDRPKDGEEAWLDAPSVKSADSGDSGLFEGDAKKRRVSPPYTSGSENSPARSAEKDADYYGYYAH